MTKNVKRSPWESLTTLNQSSNGELITSSALSILHQLTRLTI
ncbi:hypothetical protein LINPERPRIM_LOCUS16181 [Linum perenne]